jgi:hypothetical protein
MFAPKRVERTMENRSIGTISIASRRYSLRQQHLTDRYHVSTYLAIEPRARDSSNKELRPVGIGSSVRHGEEPRDGMRDVKGLVYKAKEANIKQQSMSEHNIQGIQKEKAQLISQ